jgi:hypothetical protein
MSALPPREVPIKPNGLNGAVVPDATCIRLRNYVGTVRSFIHHSHSTPFYI